MENETESLIEKWTRENRAELLQANDPVLIAAVTMAVTNLFMQESGESEKWALFTINHTELMKKICQKIKQEEKTDGKQI